MTSPETPAVEPPSDESVSLEGVLADLRAHLLWQETEGGRLVMLDHAARRAAKAVPELPRAAPASRPVASVPAARDASGDPAAARRPPAPVTAARGPAASAPAAQAPAPSTRESMPPRAPPAALAAKPAATEADALSALVALGETPTLDEVRRALGDCHRCKLCSGRTNLVFGVGNPRAKLVFVGEGPGAEEDAQGIPFVGAAGQLLTKMIEAMGYSRDEVYICNVVKCRPPNNRNPEPEEIAACEPFLQAQLKAIRPEVIVALGKFAAQTLLKDATPITRLRGQWREYQGIALMPTFHPAYLLRNPNEKKTVWADLQQVMARLGKTKKKEGGA